MPWLVVLFGLATTAVIVQQLWSRGNAEKRADEDVALTTLSASIETRLSGYRGLLYGMEGLFVASDQVSRDGFRRFVAAERSDERFPGTQALEWAPLVQRSELDRFVDTVRNDTTIEDGGYPDFDVRTAGDATELVVVTYVEPLAGNEAAFGFDLASNAARLGAIEEARSTRRPVATAPIDLMQETESQGGMLLLLAVFDERSPAPDNFLGVVLAVFRLGDLLASVSAPSGVDYVVHDIGATGETAASPVVEIHRTRSDLEPSDRQVMLDVDGRAWRVTLAAGQFGGPGIAGLILGSTIGVLATLALAGAAATLAQANQRAQAQAQVLTEDLRETYAELERTSSRLSRAVDAAQIGFWERNLQTGEAWGSDGLAEMMGDDPETWQYYETFRERLHPDDREIGLAPTPAGQHTAEKTFRLRHADGGYRWIMSRSQHIGRGGYPYLVGVQLDVTERTEWAGRLEALNRDLLRSNQSLREFTHVASHDLRSPIRAIGSLVSFIREDAPDLDDHVVENLDRIEERIARMNALIDDLLTYARAANSEEQSSTFELGPVVEDVVATLDVPDGMVVRHVGDPTTVHLERAALSTCLRNLVDNAIKHHDDPARATITVFTEIEEHGLRCSVIDDGPGIAEQYLDTIFEPFRRLDSHAISPGSGVGLAVIQRICERHGARVDVESRVGDGTTFTIRWPLRCG